VEASRVRCVLVIADGPSRRVGPSGVLIGRQDDCDLVGDDPRLSRRHALVRLTSGGAEILPVGKQPIDVNGKSFDRPAELRDGDVIKLPGMQLSVQLAAQRPAPEGPALFRLERGRGGSFGVTHSPFVIGGGRGDDLIVKGWPNSALVLHVAQRELFVEVASGRAKRNDADLGNETLEPLAPGDTLAYRDETFAITMAAHTTAATTAVAPQGPGLPSRVEIEVLPRGGRVVFAMNDGDRTVFLHDRRLDLVVALLRPPDGYRPGEFIPDELVSAIVWPRNPGASRTEINVLIARCRKDLVEAGLAGPRLLQRAPTGGATRIELAPGAEVVVRS
jgi:hypothetical protein